MRCELCGRPIADQPPIEAWIEGARLTVCRRCSRYGSPARAREALPQHAKVVSNVGVGRKTSRAGFGDLVLVEGYNLIIKQARERMNMTQAELAKLVGEKESIIRRLEGGRMTPSLDLAKKLERALKIKLFEEARRFMQEVPRPKSLQLTLGDVVTIREKPSSKGLQTT
ncbi:MAG: multiprotein bridging factor aMBF1 [Candidatus Nezhaarchaeota archaeon]|nr:multiprotein bridging factor aMBF1 [Candidatus Nezhaarchaeota archaeon]